MGPASSHLPVTQMQALAAVEQARAPLVPCTYRETPMLLPGADALRIVRRAPAILAIFTLLTAREVVWQSSISTLFNQTDSRRAREAV